MSISLLPQFYVWQIALYFLAINVRVASSGKNTDGRYWAYPYFYKIKSWQNENVKDNHCITGRITYGYVVSLLPTGCSTGTVKN